MKVVFYTGYHHTAWTPTDEGLGGTETAVVNISKYLAMAGHTVVVVGNVVTGLEDGVFYSSTEDYKNRGSMGDRPDYLIGVNYIHFMEELGFLNPKECIFWAHNPEHFPYWNGEIMDGHGDWIYDDPRLTSVVCVSKYHAEIYADRYPQIAHKIKVIENGINPHEFPKKPLSIVPGKFLYSSAADRGLDNLLAMWPDIKRMMPYASLSICTPDYARPMLVERMNDIKALSDITVLGPLPKSELYEQMVTAEYWAYPSQYDETYCITALEMLYGNVIPITTDSGNLPNIITKERGFVSSAVGEWEDFKQSFLANVHTAASLTETEKSGLRDGNWEWAYDQTWYKRSLDWIEFLQRKTVKDVVSKILIITLNPNDKEKHAEWERELSLAGFGDVPCELVQAIDGRKVDENYLALRKLGLYEGWELSDSDNGWWNRPMTPGEIGCALSHLGCWKLAANRDFDNVLILEEDFATTGQLSDVVVKDLPCNWDMLYLGRNKLGDDYNVISENLVVPGPSYNMHAYVLSKTGIRKLIDQQFDNKLMPVDEFIIATYAQHPRPDLDFIWRDMNAYAVDKDVFVQRSNQSTSMTENIHLLETDDPVAVYDNVTKREQDFAAYVKEVGGISHPTRLHPDLYTFFTDKDTWCEKFLSPGVQSKDWDLLMDEPMDGVGCVKFFTDEFCDKIIEEAEHYGKWTTDRHEFYPTTDFVLSEIGFDEIFRALMVEYAMPMSVHMFGLEGQGWDDMRTENFMARYTPQTQGHLAIHHDASDITTLINLSEPDDDFEGGGTWFHRQKKLYRPKRGSLSIHPGSITHKHGARAVTKGRRYIMVSFMQNAKKW